MDGMGLYSASKTAAVKAGRGHVLASVWGIYIYITIYIQCRGIGEGRLGVEVMS